MIGRPPDDRCGLVPVCYTLTLYFLRHCAQFGEVAGEFAKGRGERENSGIFRQVEHGFRRYFKLDPWNVLDAVVLVGFVGLFTLRMLDAELELLVLGMAGMLLPAILRLLQVFEMHAVLGPLVRSIVNMGRDIATFLVLCAIVLSGFTLAFTLLFSASSEDYASYTDTYVFVCFVRGIMDI